MSSRTRTEDRIGPKLSLADVNLPPALGERFRRLYGSDEVPANGREWIDLMREAVRTYEGRDPTVEDLCTADDGDHAFVGAESEQSYVCVLDPLSYPFLTGETGTIRSTTPVRAATVAFEVREDGVDVSHEDAVVSLGISDHLDKVDEVTLDVFYRQVCGYIQTFEDADEYEMWTAEVDAATIPLSAREGVAVAREIAAHLFEEDGEL
jgi:hypothetical protein